MVDFGIKLKLGSFWLKSVKNTAPNSRFSTTTRGTKYSYLKQKTWSKIEQTLPDCPSDENCLQCIGHNLTAIFAFYGPKKAKFATRGKKHWILKQTTLSQKKWGQTLPDNVFWYYPSDINLLQWIGHNYMAKFLAKKCYFCHQRHKILKF